MNMPKMTQEELEQFRKEIKVATITDIGIAWKENVNAELAEDVANYLSNFAARKSNPDGTFTKGNPCLRCNMPLQPTMVEQLFNEGGFTWGLAHGQGFCKKCGWPSTLYHFIKDRHGIEVMTVRHIVLQIHPKHIEIKE